MGICSSSKDERIEEYPSISDELHKYLIKSSKSLCKIQYKNHYGSGFLLKLFKGEHEFLCLVTCEHIITRKMIQQREEINFYFDSNDIKKKQIKLDPDKRYIQDFINLDEIDKSIDINMDITVVEIITEDNILKDYFLTVNQNYINNFFTLQNKEIIIMKNDEYKVLEYTIGKIINIEKYEFTHSGNHMKGSTGSPIFLRNSIEVIGIQIGVDKNNQNIYGNFIGPIFNYLKNFTENKNILNFNLYKRKIL